VASLATSARLRNEKAGGGKTSSRLEKHALGQDMVLLAFAS